MSRSHAVRCRIQGEGYRNNIELLSLDGQNSGSMLATDYTPPICLLVTRDAFHVSSIALRFDEIDHVLVRLAVFVRLRNEGMPKCFVGSDALRWIAFQKSI
jgi:hypothetical protein